MADPYYVAPNTAIILCRGVPLDAQYEHTFFFNPFGGANAKTAQYNTIAAYAKYTYTAQYYQRHEKNKLRIQVLADNVLDCNYMIFQNTAFGSKYFYAFITHVEYINNNTTEITYEIDVMQTYNFDYALGDCFVEREHVTDDRFGKNLIDEGLDTGDYVVNTAQSKIYPRLGASQSPIGSYARITYIPNDKVLSKLYFPNGSPVTDLIMANYDPAIDCGQITCGQVQPACYAIVPVVNGSDWTPKFLTATINKLISGGATIISIDCIPANIAESTGYNITRDFVNQHIPELPQTPPTVTLSMDEGAAFKDIDNSISTDYTPNNNKLYCSPYRKIIMSNHSGKTNELKWENFKDRSVSGRPSVQFPVQAFIIPKTAVYCYPSQYRGIAEDYDSGLSLDNFAEFMWSEDAYTKWLAQNADANRQKIANSVISGTLRGLTTAGVAALTVASGGTALPVVAAVGGAAGAGISTVNAVLGNMAAKTSAQDTPDAACGSAERNDIPLCNNALGFTIYDMNIRPAYAKRIDHFFDLYGYKVNELKMPNVRDSAKIAGLRSVWNYVKTGNVNIHPANSSVGLNQAAENKIADIYNKGITFWMNYNGAFHVGDYSTYAANNKARVR